MRIYSYVVARDYGFAPNPFFGICTLATCKPKIRNNAQIGDWIVGTGSKRYGLQGHLVFAMKICSALTFDEYWKDPLFSEKKPNLRGSLKQAFGDNIYRRHSRTRQWIQVDSHHSLATGKPNPANIEHDTQVDRLLTATTFVYFGASGPKIPKRFRNFEGWDICCVRGHKSRFPDSLVASFVKWLDGLGLCGYQGDPYEFRS